VYESQDQVKRYVFRSRRNLSGPTAGSRRLSGSKFEYDLWQAAHAHLPLTKQNNLTSAADVPCRRALRYAGTNRLVVPPVRLSTVGSRAFPVAAAQIWNSLPEHIVSAPTLQSFKRHLKAFLLQRFFCL